jgi:hypothetical protein
MLKRSTPLLARLPFASVRRTSHERVIGGYTREGGAESGSRCKSDTVLATVTRELEPHVATGPTGLGRRGGSARSGSQEIVCIVV